MKEIILFLDYSVFPVSNDIILENIDLAISNGCKIIFIDFGQFFPWSIDNIIKSDFSYSEKLVDRINSVCKQNEIILVPVLSVLIDSDYILNDNKYSLLKEDGYKNQGLNISSCGASKLIEELIEDLFSLFTKSEYLFFEIPAITYKDEEWVGNIDPFIKRLTLFMRNQNKKLIFGDNMNLKRIYPESDINRIVEYYNKSSGKIEVYKGKSLSIFYQIYKIRIKNMEYSMYKLKKCCILPSVFAFMMFTVDGNISTNNKYKIDFEIVDDFLSSLEKTWSIIRKSSEFISILDRTPNNKYRIQFYRIVEEFKQEFVLLKKHSNLIKNVLEEKFQTGFFTLWVNSKIDPVYL
ncbi:hypothetical protein J7L48_05215, partial [bacterium]|nr:hypothetical protein [bacterium]